MVCKSVRHCTGPRPKPARRRGRGLSDRGRRLQVGGRLRQPDRTPFFRLTPAFGLRLQLPNRYLMSGFYGTGPPAGDRPRRYTAAGQAAACRKRRIGDRKIGAG